MLAFGLCCCRYSDLGDWPVAVLGVHCAEKDGLLFVAGDVLEDVPEVLISCGEPGNTNDPPGGVVVWAYCADGGKMSVEVYPADDVDNVMTFEGPDVNETTGYTGKMFITELETGWRGIDRDSL